jgi:hypothetical protein
MESFKHSCPYCGQHIEYTASYCGKQIQCPICGNTITFPAIPPQSGGAGVRINRPEDKPARKWAWNLQAIFLFLRDFQHWKTVVQCVVPFLIVGALLAGAAYVKNKFADQPAAPPEPIVQANPDAWQKMTELTRAEQAVKDQITVLVRARASVKQAEEIRAATHRQYPGNSNPLMLRTADETAQKAQNNYNKARQHFENLLEQYRKLGGTHDYRGEAPN